jgi:hypothetical protein
MAGQTGAISTAQKLQITPTFQQIGNGINARLTAAPASFRKLLPPFQSGINLINEVHETERERRPLSTKHADPVPRDVDAAGHPYLVMAPHIIEEPG